MISQKNFNFNYAPGIATYGIQGVKGKTGISGNNIFYTNYKLDDADEVHLLNMCIEQNLMPVKGTTEKAFREYQDYDYFFDTGGRVWQAHPVEDLTNETDKYQFDQVAKLQIEPVGKEAGLIKYNSLNNRIVLDASMQGLDITDYSNYNGGQSDYNLRIFSNKTDANDNINFIKFAAVDPNSMTEGNLNVFFSTTDYAFHLTSDRPIVLNNIFNVNSATPETEYDEYSPIVLSTNPITKFKQLAENITYAFDADNHIILTVNNTEDYNEIKVTLNESVYVRIQAGNYLFAYLLKYTAQDPLIIYDDVNKTITVPINEYISTVTDEPIIVSLLYNIEVFLKKSN